MSLRPEEIDRLRWELGVSVVRLGAEPWIGFSAIFDVAIAKYLYDNSTTSSTAVTAVAAGAQVTLALAANPFSAGNATSLTFQVGTNVTVDVGPNAENAIIQAISGLNATLTLTNAHSGTYPVSPVGSESLVRACFSRIDAINTELLSVSPKTAGMVKVDEIEFVPASKGRGIRLDKFQSLLLQRERARDDLGELVGYPNLRSQKRGGGMSFEVY